jgi:hypothetical protein
LQLSYCVITELLMEKKNSDCSKKGWCIGSFHLPPLLLCISKIISLDKFIAASFLMGKNVQIWSIQNWESSDFNTFKKMTNRNEKSAENKKKATEPSKEKQTKPMTP